MNNKMGGESRFNATVPTSKVERRAERYGEIERGSENGFPTLSLKSPDMNRLTVSIMDADGVSVVRVKEFEEKRGDTDQRRNTILQLIWRLMEAAIKEHDVKFLELPVEDTLLIGKLLAMKGMDQLLGLDADEMKAKMESLTGREATGVGEPIRIPVSRYEEVRDSFIEEGILRS